MLDWLAQLLHRLTSVVPRLFILRTTHRAVKFVHGKHAKPLEPGLHMWWPLVTEILSHPVARQTCNLPTQSLLLHEEKALSVSGVVVYTIEDVEKALTLSWDLDESISDVGLSAVAEIVAGRELSSLLADLKTGALTKELTSRCRSRLRLFGVRVESCALTDFCISSVVRVLGGQVLPLGDQTS